MTGLVTGIIKGHNKRYNNSILKSNINFLNKFDEAIYDKALGTRDRRIRILSMMTRKINKPFKQMTNSDVVSYLANLKNENGEDKKPSSREHHKITIVMFFLWLYKREKGEKSPPVVKGIKCKSDAFQIEIDPKSLWNDDEIKQLVKNCSNSRDMAFLMTLYDSGARIGELLSMNIKDVSIEGDICYIFLPESKTKRRRVCLLMAKPYLEDWSDHYPEKYKQDGAPLWMSFSPNNFGGRLNESSTFEILTKIRDRAGLTKKINHHIMRHSRISHCRKAGMPDVLNRRRHGLRPGSLIIERYTHIDDEEVSNGYQKAMGYEPVKPIVQDPNILKPQKCFRCGAQNPATADFCKKCFTSLNYESIARDLDLLDMFRTNFASFEGVNLEKIVKNYQKFKAETHDMQKVLDCFNGGDVVLTNVLRKQLALEDDEALALFQYLMTCELIDVIDDKVTLSDRRKFESFIKMQKHYLERKT